jgi:glycosyltransferase involved in cell wall biosynthesis
MTTVSIIMPTYNAADTLVDTLDSVTAQDYPHWELLIIDDGSTDDTLALARQRAAQDARIHVYAYPNRGPSAARNTGIARAKGTIIAFLDADDLWKHDKLSTHVACFNARPEVDLSFGRVRFFAQSPELGTHRSKVPARRLTMNDVLAENPACTGSNLVVRTTAMEHLGGFDETLRHAEDQEWLIRAVHRGLHVEGIDCELVAYRCSDSSASADLDSMLADWQVMLHRIPNLDATTIARAEATYHRYLARHALRTGQTAARAMHHIGRGLRSSPGGFFGDVRRATLTVFGALAATLVPAAMRSRVLADS